MENTTDNFAVLDGASDQVGNAKNLTAKEIAKKQQVEDMKNVFKAAALEDPTLLQNAGSYSKFVEVLNSLGFSDTGGIIYGGEKPKVDADGNKTKTRDLPPTSGIVGYRVRNNGKETLAYETEDWAFDKTTGQWVGNRVEKQLAPGGVVDLPRRWMTVFSMQVPISMEYANGAVKVRIPSTPTTDEALIKVYESSFFQFGNDSGLKVHDDAVKINISQKMKDGKTGVEKWIVKPEFEKTFGFLNNEKSTERKGRKATPQASTQTVTATYLRKLTEGSGL